MTWVATSGVTFFEHLKRALAVCMVVCPIFAAAGECTSTSGARRVPLLEL
jgi:hypothetical protein